MCIHITLGLVQMQVHILQDEGDGGWARTQHFNKLPEQLVP